MQCKSYFPGFYSTRDLNANGSTWPLYNDDKTLKSEYYYSGFLPPASPDQYLGYDKEVFRQTMLKHEIIFRDQVHELHRLYGRQKGLMDEIKRKELYKHHLLLETSQSNPFPSQISSEYAQKTWHIPSMPSVNTACSRPSVSGAENIQSPSSFMKGKTIQAGLVTTQTESSLNDCKLLESKCKKFRRRMFDLQLPADEYIDSEEGESLEEEKVSEVPEAPSHSRQRISEVLPQIDVTGSFLRRTNGLADLNEPIQLEEAAAPNSIDFLGPITCDREIPCRDLSEKTNSGFQVLSKEIFQNIQTRRDLEACSNILHLEKERQREWLPYNDEAGHSRGNSKSCPQDSSPGKLPTSFEPLQVELQAHEIPKFHLSDQSNRRSWNERTNFGLEISERDHDLFNNNYPRPAGASCIPTSYQLAPQSDVAKSEPSSVSSWKTPVRELRQNPIAVQALPCFNTPPPSSKSAKSSIGIPRRNVDKFYLNRNLKSSPSFGSGSLLQNGFCHGSKSKTSEACPPSVSFDHLNSNNDNDSASEHHGPTKSFKGSDCMVLKSAKDMNLKVMPPNCSPNVAVSQQNIQTIGGEKKLEDSSGGFPWLRAKSVCSGKPHNGREELSQMKSGFLQAFSSCIRDVELKKVEASDCPSNKKFFGLPMFDKPHISNDWFSSLTSPSNSYPTPAKDEAIESSVKVGALNINLGCDPASDSRKLQNADDLVVASRIDNKLSGRGYHIDLNSCINEDESSPTHSVPRAIMKIAAEIDLEAPVSPENEECSPPRGKFEDNQLKIPFQLSQWEDGDLQEERVRIAAEAIVFISSSGVQTCVKSGICEPSEASSDSLHWFAGVVSSVAGDLENEVGVVLNGKDDGVHGEFLSDEIDYFEAMTLKLTETKVEEYWCESNGQKEEETSATLMPSQPRKGRTRKGRQRKDFQREILPCLASLSRHEVTEDLQTIGGLIEAAGTPSETGLVGRNAGRNGWARGRRRSYISASNVLESKVCSQLKQQTNNNELRFEERGLTGWGKITRRRRGQRFPASNPLLILNRVY